MEIGRPGTEPSRVGVFSKNCGLYFCHQFTTAKFCERMMSYWPTDGRASPGGISSRRTWSP